MDTIRAIALTTIAASLACCTSAEEQAADAPIAVAKLKSAAGESVGEATLLEEGGNLTLEVTVAGITSGPHGFHLHTTGECQAPDFRSAGSHLNPHGASHGSLNPQGQHVGDLENLEVGDDGGANIRMALAGGSAEMLGFLFDDDGTAIVIHEGPDDYQSDPAGAAGSRIACGVLLRG